MRAFRTALVALVLLAACSSGGDDDPTASTTASTEPTASTESTAGATSTTVGEGALADVAFDLVEVADLDEPMALRTRNGSIDFYVAQKGGLVRRLSLNSSKGSITAERTPVLDLTDDVSSESEQGLLGIEFSLDGRKLYVNYTDLDGNTHVDEYQMDAEKAVTSSKRELLVVEQPFPNHNGGDLHIGPDGYLYVALGDGGDAGDPEENAEDTTSLLGKVLRIDPDGRTGDKPYGIPAGNPFADGEDGAPEIWLYGVRNPWRMSFDATTGDLWIGDVGQGDWEEVDVLRAVDGGGRGANLGWDLREGTHEFEGDAPEGAVEPVIEYGHEATGGCSVTGGYVYRGLGLPALVGAYVYADYCLNELRLAIVEGTEVVATRTVPTDFGKIVSFGEDNGRELYVLSQDGGVYRLQKT